MNCLNFITTEFPIPEALNNIEDHLIFSFSISDLKDIKKIDMEKLHASRIYLKENISFSVYLNFTSDHDKNKTLIEALLENKNFLLQLFFHPQFLYDKNKPVIFISNEGRYTDYTKNFIEAITAFFISRQLEGLECAYFSTVNNYSDLQTSVLFEFKENFKFEDNYYELLTSKYYVANYLGIINNSKKTIQDILQRKTAVEEKFKSKLPRQYLFYQKFILLKAEKPFWEDKLKQATAELENQKKYMVIIRTQDEAAKINSFYYHEYEILPLWYKKFGHIIKVLQGKRAFKSLYNSNVKKYRS